MSDDRNPKRLFAEAVLKCRGKRTTKDFAKETGIPERTLGRILRFEVQKGVNDDVLEKLKNIAPNKRIVSELEEYNKAINEAWKKNFNNGVYVSEYETDECACIIQMSLFKSGKMIYEPIIDNPIDRFYTSDGLAFGFSENGAKYVGFDTLYGWYFSSDKYTSTEMIGEVSMCIYQVVNYSYLKSIARHEHKMLSDNYKRALNNIGSDILKNLEYSYYCFVFTDISLYETLLLNFCDALIDFNVFAVLIDLEKRVILDCKWIGILNEKRAPFFKCPKSL